MGKLTARYAGHNTLNHVPLLYLYYSLTHSNFHHPFFIFFIILLQPLQFLLILLSEALTLQRMTLRDKARENIWHILRLLLQSCPYLYEHSGLYHLVQAASCRFQNVFQIFKHLLCLFFDSSVNHFSRLGIYGICPDV